MATFIGDVALPRGVWTRLTPNGPAPHFQVMNAGRVSVLVKKSAAAPTDAGGAMRLAPGRMLPPEDLSWHGLDVWARADAADGLAAVEAFAEPVIEVTGSFAGAWPVMISAPGYSWVLQNVAIFISPVSGQNSTLAVIATLHPDGTLAPMDTVDGVSANFTTVSAAGGWGPGDIVPFKISLMHDLITAP